MEKTKELVKLDVGGGFACNLQSGEKLDAETALRRLSFANPKDPISLLPKNACSGRRQLHPTAQRSPKHDANKTDSSFIFIDFSNAIVSDLLCQFAIARGNIFGPSSQSLRCSVL